eukprot:3311089-Rhodomonas_salina.1
MGVPEVGGPAVVGLQELEERTQSDGRLDQGASRDQAIIVPLRRGAENGVEAGLTTDAVKRVQGIE